jgi:transposase-like protein
MGTECKHCHGTNTKKNGKSDGIQRYICDDSCRTFSIRDERFSEASKQKVLQMYLNNVGIRKTALLTGVSRQTVLTWVKRKGQWVAKNRKIMESDMSTEPDIIELDEIYTQIKKNR